MKFNLKNPFIKYPLPIILNLIINYWISHLSDDNAVIKFLNTYSFSIPINIITIIITLTIIYMAYIDISDFIKNDTEQKIQNAKDPLIAQNEKLNEQLNTKAGSLINSFSQLQHFQEKEVLLKHLKEFLDSHELIHSAQIYTYSKKILDGTMIIDVSYLNGYVYNRVDINAMIHSIYEINSNIYSQIYNIIESKHRIDVLNEELSKIKPKSKKKELSNTIDNLIENLNTNMSTFISSNTQYLNSRNIDELNESDSIIFALLELCTEFYLASNLNEEDAHGTWELTITNDERKDKRLRRLKRTGLLNGILKVNTHTFRNKGYTSKKDRLYITRCFTMNSLNCIMCLSLNPNYSEEDYECDLLTEEFLELLNKDFNMCYNSKYS